MIFENVIGLCKKNGVSVSKLEKDVGLANATVRKWAGSSPTVENLQKVADYFGVTVDDLLKKEE